MTGRPRRTSFASATIRSRFDADEGRKIGLVDHQEIGLEDAEPAFARDIVAAGRIDDEQPIVDELEREGRGEIVAAGLDQHDIEIREVRRQVARPPECSRSGSSRIAVCGQAPVSTASTRAGSIKPDRLIRSASSCVTRSLATTPTSRSRAVITGIRRSTSAVLPEPTGPPMPMRATPGSLARPLIAACISAQAAGPSPARRSRARRRHRRRRSAD